jgi:RNA polymerase primary sigma factor
LGDCIADSGERTDALALQKNQTQKIANLLQESLTDQENKVIGLYYGLDVDADLNLKEIGTMVGLSKERVRQVKENALAKLRTSEVGRIIGHAA